MSSWRDEILQKFMPGAERLTIAADPDGLLLEEGVLKGLEDRGFDLIPFDDHVAFRYAYESQYRARWDRGEETDLVVVLRAPRSETRELPFDLLEAGHLISVSLVEIFPNLSPRVIDALDRADLDLLFKAQEMESPGQLTEGATKDFVLMHVFGIAPATISTPAGLLRFLIRRHHQELRIPPILDQRFVQSLSANDRFREWPLAELVADRQVFFRFLQERWPYYLDRVSMDVDAVCEPKSGYNLDVAGPVDLPFDHPDVGVLLDNLFLEGLLEPVEHPKSEQLVPKLASLAVGVRIDPAADLERKLEGLLENAGSDLPQGEARYTDWLSFAQRWSHVLCALAGETDIPAEVRERAVQVRSNVDQAFDAWVRARYGTLYNQPPSPPVMLHHVPRYLARRMDGRKSAKVALVVADGLSYEQWLTVRQVMNLRTEMEVDEHAVFAWVPTITSVSRQTVFAGRMPLYFSESIHTTNKEESLWKRFWADEGLTGPQVRYLRSLADVADLKQVEEVVAHPKVRVVGLVVDKVDKIMHGMEQGATGMHAMIRLWAQEGFLVDLFDLLLKAGFEVYLTSDHGNIETEGWGRPSEGSLAWVKGERVRIYNEELLRKRVHEDYPDAIAWPAVGLPEDCLPLLASGRAAFAIQGQRSVTHGGASLEEMVVPFVRIGRDVKD